MLVTSILSASEFVPADNRYGARLTFVTPTLANTFVPEITRNELDDCEPVR